MASSHPLPVELNGMGEKVQSPIKPTDCHSAMSSKAERVATDHGEGSGKSH